MEKTPKQHMTESLIQFGRLFQLPEPSAEYVDAIYNALHSYQWTLKQFVSVLNQLVKNSKYIESARFGKYPTIYDFLHTKSQLDSKPFYDALSAYLSGEWWTKDEVLTLATPTQMNAISLSGGLSKLYERANCEISTPVYKLVDIVAENESEVPAERIDNEHRIGGPSTLKQIVNTIKKGTDVGA